MLALAISAMPAGATSKEPVGDRINVLLGFPTTFAAEAPFNIRHGWQISADNDAIGKFSFALDIDGTPRDFDFVLKTVTSGDPDVQDRFWVFNFPSGLSAGTHTFVGRWLAPCYTAIQLDFPGPCRSPNTVEEAFRRTLTVTFS
jgi:hypothetical protein